MTTVLAIIVFIVGVALFGIGIVGQIGLGRRKSRGPSPTGDRAGARLVLTLAAIIVGAWMVIASASAILHAHAHSTRTTQTTS
ncbi:hypothetical protein [Acidipila sp. EB88]|uniref:hypothetical protein n=1 Tax=Acidipila sp. EB88 TaxID=2305226 RepID=UPI000F5EA02C|nr:hypothetical protein [Acidipila sp. EB88]RRA49798.1 hypothetical protein D1Y84_17535 [Acidipila sp. EB88]